MRRTLIPIAALLFALAVPTAAGAATVGVSDQFPGTFTNPLFAPLKMKEARYITPYDVMDSPSDKAALDNWLAGATTAHQKILISFEHSHRSTSRAKKAPTVAAYTKAIKKFKAAYPQVKEISPWNEVNRCQSVRNGSVQGQPTCHNPTRVAEYYMAARKVWPGRTIVAIDLLDQKNVKPSIAYLRSFLRHAKPYPKIIGLHNYSDTNRFSTNRTKQVLATFRGKVWLTETGGEVKLGSVFPFSTSRAAKALGCMFSIAKKYSRIQRLYVYQFSPAASPSDFFDAGLINPDNTTRPGYDVVKSRKARACHK